VLNTQNAGSTRNKGIEMTVNYGVMRQKNLNWDMQFNFNRMRNRVVKLPPSVQEYYIADTWLYTARGGLKLNGPTTSLTGSTYLRNNAGQILINPSNGLPISSGGVYSVIGDRNPDFSLGWSNSVRWKNWKLSMLWDLKVGGDIFNGTNLFLSVNGVSKFTADRYRPRVIQGVLNDGLQNSGNPTPNTIVVIPAFNDAYYSALPDEEFVERDVNWFRLRDITVSYSFPKDWIRAVKNLSAFITGNDLVVLTNYSGADPAINGNTAGGRGVGAFGYDYGTLPAPLSVNFGLKASF